MAIEIHIQIDYERKDNQIVAKICKDDTNLAETSTLIAELERAKLHLLKMNFEKDIGDYN